MAESFIQDNLQELNTLLYKLKCTFEIICVVDGGADNTLNKAKDAAKKIHLVKVYSYINNRGKGYAVRYGMKKAQGEIIGFVDAGNDLQYKDLLKLFEIMNKNKADIIIGSKRHSDSTVIYPAIRKIYSFGYQFYVKNLFGLKVNDTQVGMKLFKGRIIKKILPLLTIDGFAFDIEALATASEFYNAKIIEAPIHVNLEQNFSTTKIKGGLLKSSIEVFLDTLRILYKLRISGFYKNKLPKK